MNRALTVFLLTFAGGGAWAALAPGPAIQPGQLLAAHAQLRNDCAACHALGSGVESARCVKCHERASIGLTPGRPRPDVAALHAPLAEVECAACHAEHAGRLGRAPAARFRHEMIESDLRADCRRCHDAQRPADALHKAAGNSCAACHTSESWKPASFEHSVLGRDDSCAGCHASKAPSDELHAQLKSLAESDCRACHATDTWKSATYDHARWFRFDRNHPARCNDCHEPAQGFKTYTCNTCHPMSRMQHEHDEVGARDLAKCAECHKSGNKHDAEHGGEGREGGKREHGEEDEDH